jgi:hypothetical protein
MKTKTVNLTPGIVVTVHRMTNRDRADRDTMYVALGYNADWGMQKRQEEFCTLIVCTDKFEAATVDDNLTLPNRHESGEALKAAYERFLDYDNVITALWVDAIENMNTVNRDIATAPVAPSEAAVQADPN